jgi:LacI family transcriptional regulator
LSHTSIRGIAGLRGSLRRGRRGGSAGTAVPTQVAVAGIDDGPLAASHGLTTVRQPFAESGRRAAELLRSLIRSPGQTVARTLLTPQLDVRDTT